MVNFYLINQRKLCQWCNNPLMSFQGYYLHPEIPCAGIQDFIHIEAEIEDELIHKKFIELYGEPQYSDYQMIAMLEEENNRMSKQLVLQEQKMIEWQRIVHNPLVRFIIRILRLNPPL